MLVLRFKFAPMRPSLAERARSFDLDRARAELADGMLKHWKAGMASGVMANGAALPIGSSTGRPIGIGSGSILDGWQATNEGKATRIKPYTVGKYQAAVNSLVKRGVVYHSFAGPSGAAARAILKRQVRRLRDHLLGRPTS